MDLHDPQKREKKKRQLGEYTAIFTSRLDKNEYLFAFIIDRLSFLSVSCFWFLVSFYGCHSLIFIFFDEFTLSFCQTNIGRINQ